MLDIPMIASGGIADARGLVAALALGEDGVNMGTRFMCTQESGIDDAVKAQFVAGTELDTTLIFRSLRNTARVATDAVGTEVIEIERSGGPFDDIRDLVSGARGSKVFENGDLDAGILTVGLCQGLIDDIPTVAELVERMVSEAELLIRQRLGDLLDESVGVRA